MLEQGQSLERYRVEALVGEGGVAAVYRVVHESLGSVHALKVLQVSSDKARRRLLHEGRSQARVHHPNLVAVTDVLTVGGRPALVLEYVDGPSLETFLAEQRPSAELALQLFHGIVRGVQAAHHAGLVHRDLKPANILLAPSEEGWIPKVADFGLVKDLDPGVGNETSDHGMLGTPQYMSPEQLTDQPDVDERADLFALGCILYELVTGHRAFDGQDIMEIAAAICDGRYDPPHDVPDAVSASIEGLLRVDRTQRIASCDHLLSMLYALEPMTLDQATPPGPSTPVGFRHSRPSDPQPTLPPVRGSRRLTMFGVVTLSVLVVAGLWAVLQGLTTPPEPAVERVAPATAPDPVVVAPEPAPVVAPAPAPPRPRPARVSVEGDATVELVDRSGAVHPVGSVAAGTWTWRATFPGLQPVEGTVELAAGEAVVLRCSSFAGQCRVTR